MHQTKRELLDEFLQFVGDPNDDTARTIAEGCLNRAFTSLWMARPWAAFRSPVPLNLTLTVNQARYALPDYFGRVGPGEMRNISRGGAIIKRLGDGELEQLFPNTGTSFEIAGPPARYELSGVCGVQTQVAAAGEALEVLSSVSGDTDVVVAIDGEDGSGYWTRYQVTLTGTTPVALGTWTYVDEFSKAFPAGTTPATPGTSSRGIVTLRKASGGSTRQVLYPQESARQHDVLTFYPKPDQADVVTVPFVRKLKRLFEDADPLPDLWGPALFEEMGLEWEVNGKTMTRVDAQNAPRPKRLDLIAFENQQEPRLTKRAFGY